MITLKTVHTFFADTYVQLELSAAFLAASLCVLVDVWTCRKNKKKESEDRK